MDNLDSKVDYVAACTDDNLLGLFRKSKGLPMSDTFSMTHIYKCFRLSEVYVHVTPEARDPERMMWIGYWVHR
jgi:hypothetical protein